MIDLTTQVGPLRLKNPVLVASGTFGYAQESAELVDLAALGGIVTKSVTLKPRPGNPPSRIVELPAGMLNSIGLANVGVEAFVREKLPFLRGVGTTIIVNVAGGSAEEFEQVLRRLEQESGIDAYELNFSCPNVKEGGLEFSQNADVTASVTARLRRLTARPLIVKLTPNVTRVSEIARAAAENGADAVSLINTVVGMAVDVGTRRAKLSTVTGGYSGPAIKPIALAKVYEVAQNVSVPIIGIGGIMNTEDALEFMLTGACAVQVGTANFIDPGTGPKIVEGLRAYGEQHGLHAIQAIVGTLQNTR
ncbi:MAG: dihydroorotate dehydrogenase [Calditrichaeota bacterium]|nr:MAG: dihydroorotate dehydrogenase [Calditrichota bacterium]